MFGVMVMMMMTMVVLKRDWDDFHCGPLLFLLAKLIIERWVGDQNLPPGSVLLLNKRNEVHIRVDPLLLEGRYHAWICWAAHDELVQLSLTLLFGRRALNCPHSSRKF